LGELICAFFYFPLEPNGLGALPALIFAHLFLAAAASFALCAGDMPPFFFTGAGAFDATGAFTFAQRFFCDALILAMVAADRFLFLPSAFTGAGAAFTAGVELPKIAAISASSAAICSEILTAWVSCSIVGVVVMDGWM